MKNIPKLAVPGARYARPHDALRAPGAHIKFNNYIDELIQAKRRLETEKLIIKDIRSMISAEFKINPKHVNLIVKSGYNGDMKEALFELEEGGEMLRIQLDQTEGHDDDDSGEVHAAES